jgi:uncharacterized membrane protein YesL
MIAGLLTCWRGFRHLNHRGYIYIWANLLWVLLSLPIVTAPAAWAGLIKMSHIAYTERHADLADFWDGFKENLRRGLVMTALNIVVVGINISNLAAYQNQSGLLFLALRWLWIVALLVWFTLQLYMWPLLYQMKQPNLRGAMRNAVIMMLFNPGFTIGLWIGIAVIIVFSTVLVGAWLLLTGGLLAAIATGAVLDRLALSGLSPVLIMPAADEEAVG